jgi:hypothetical protein
MNLLAEVGSEVSNVTREQVSCPSFDGCQEDRRIFPGQENSGRKGRLSRFKQLKRPRQFDEPPPLIFTREVDLCFL